MSSTDTFTIQSGKKKLLIHVPTHRQRLLSGTIDTLVIWIPTIIMGILVFKTHNTRYSNSVFSYTFFALLASYLLLKLTYQSASMIIFGKTLGQFAIQVKVISSQEYRRINSKEVLFRSLYMLVPCGWFFAFHNFHHQSFYDMNSNTIAIIDEKPEQKKGRKRIPNISNKPHISSNLKLAYVWLSVGRVLLIILLFIVCFLGDSLNSIH